VLGIFFLPRPSRPKSRHGHQHSCLYRGIIVIKMGQKLHLTFSIKWSEFFARLLSAGKRKSAKKQLTEL
jgi:hypothetical protein